MTDRDGGPAFPVSWEMDGEVVAVPGMTLRDWLASVATDADVDAARFEENVRRRETTGPHYTGCTRQEARYAHADAMLEAREESDV